MQAFALAKDFFHIDRQVPARCQAVDAPAQFAAVAPWVGEAVDVVDAQPVDQPLRHQLENLRVGRLEHRRALYAQATQLVDIEKTPPVDVVRGGAPTGKPVTLAFQQVVQALEALAGL
ncbi:hypothetical protein D3C76_1245360 [compost metagenome]